jgi:PiT family inorganic phosphate transporter
MTLLIFAFAVALYVAWCIGSNSEAMATTVGTGIFSIKRAVILSSIFSFFGILLLGHRVMETIGEGIIDPKALVLAAPLTIGLTTGIWLSLCTWRRLPISSTHSVVGAVIGYGIAMATQINWEMISWIILSMLSSPLLGLAIAFLIYRFGLRRALKRLRGVWERERVEVLFGFGQLLSASLVAFSFGANDAANAVGVLLPFVKGELLYLQLFCAIGMILGILMWSYKVIGMVGKKITEMIPSRGFVVEISAAISVLIFTFAKMPVSATQTLVGAVAGVAIARGRGRIRAEPLKSIVFSWFLTLPSTAIFSFFLTRALI